jgi:Peptidase propeptide and YPEB domain/Putative beta-lactamase-inhibitor-like, PepSY-like
MRMSIGILAIAVGLILVVGSTRADEEKTPLDKVPAAALQAVKKRFPDAQISGASKETENGKTVYEVTLKDKGRTVEVTATAEGTLLTIEREIPMKEVPEVVKKAFDAKSADAKVQSIEEVIKVEGAKETLQYYEFHLPGDVEVCIYPDGKLRDSAPAPKK